MLYDNMAFNTYMLIINKHMLLTCHYYNSLITSAMLLLIKYIFLLILISLSVHICHTKIQINKLKIIFDAYFFYLIWRNFCNILIKYLHKII